MASSRELKNRIRSTKNIRQMTKAMEAVSAVKMRRSTELALAARPYALTALKILQDMRAHTDEEEHKNLSPFFEQREEERTCLVVVTSDKGLAGAYNTNVLRAAERYIKASSHPVRVVAIGKKASDHFRDRNDVVAEFTGVGDYGTLSDTEPITHSLTEEFMSRESDRVVLIFTNFLSALKQEVVVRDLLPFTETSLQEVVDGIVPLRGVYANIPASLDTGSRDHTRYGFEPSAEQVLEEILPELLKVHVFHAILEANASEHSSRMMAMKNASENAGELIDDLTLQFNKARQASVTRELSEITSGAEALEGN